jgi:L-threonylcarbamoyladenylate synthase
MNKKEITKGVAVIRKGGIGVVPTDTMYGVVGSALMPKTVERIYAVRKRRPDKPFIILISGMEDLRQFGVAITKENESFLKGVWPGKVSVILPCDEERYDYLHRGTRTLAFRLPKSAWLRRFIKQTGPLVAPSANPERMQPAETVREAKAYFGNAVDLYLSAGRRLKGVPSTVVLYEKGRIRITRQGSVKIRVKRS